MKIYQSKYGKLSGTSYGELIKSARKIYHDIEKKTNRTPYIKTTNKSYFKGQKIFLNMFFPHLEQKSRIDRKRRLYYFQCGLDLVKNTTVEPIIKKNPNKSGETLYRFAGTSKEGDLFYVQIRENARRNKYYMSVFSPE